MLTNYYTLLHLAKQARQLVGMKVIECYSQEKDSIVIDFFDGAGIHSLFFSAKANQTVFYLDDSIRKARKNTAPTAELLLGDVLQDVELIADDRLIKIRTLNHTIMFHLYSSAAANMFVLDNSGKICYSLNGDESVGDEYSIPETNLPSFNDFLGPENLLNSLAKCDILLGKYYAEEVLIAAGLNPKLSVKDITEEQKIEMFKTAEKLIGELVHSRKFFLYDKGNGEVVLSLIKLTNFVTILYEFDSVSEAVRRTRVTRIRNKIVFSLKKDLLTLLEKEKRNYEKKILDCLRANELSDMAERNKLIGGLLLSMPNPSIKSKSPIQLTDYDGNSINVELDEKINLVENAQKYFNRAKKIQRDIAIKSERLPLLESKMKNILYFINEANNSNDPKTLQRLFDELSSKRVVKNMNVEKKKPEDKFKVFELGDGFVLYVGKNAANNDELTMKFAKPNDLWLHARGASGSHAVLPLNGAEKAPKNILKRAAEITAFYSSAKNGKYVPVCYTLRKNVRKPKGANVGAVVITREEVIMVEPREPERLLD